MNEEAQKNEEVQVKKNEKRKTSVGLGIGIILFPIVFSWFTLRRGHTMTIRLVAFGWLIATTVVWATTDLKRQTKHAQSTSVGKVYSMGERFELGGFAYRVLTAEATFRVGSSVFKAQASEGAVFCIVKFEIENMKQKTDVVLSDDFKIKDSRGRIFMTSSRVTMPLSAGGKEDFIMSQLQPGIKRKSVSGFELPINALDGDLFLVIPEKGMFSAGNVEVKLPDIGSELAKKLKKQ